MYSMVTKKKSAGVRGVTSEISLAVGVGLVIFIGSVAFLPSTSLVTGEAAAVEAKKKSDIQSNGYVYIKDTFDKNAVTLKDTFSDWWRTSSCDMTSHSDSSKPGSVSRLGSCLLKKEGDNSFVRFTVYPFDVRSLDEDSGDWGKGGGEALPRDTIENAYGYAPAKNKDKNTKGWDIGGQTYLVEGNTVRYGWDFRITDASLLESVTSPAPGLTGHWATRALSRSAVIGQLHSQANYKDQSTEKSVSCGVTVEATSPSPGLWMEVNGDNVAFSMMVKLEKSKTPAYLLPYANNCETQTDRNGSGASRVMCTIPVWSLKLKKADVINKWFTIDLDLRLSSGTNGFYGLAFGRKDLASTQAAGYKTQKFLNNARTVLDAVPTQANRCPGMPRMGIYALGFNPLYYGDVGNGAVASSERDIEAAKVVRQKKARGWVSDAYTATFIKGKDPLSAPKLVIDYDNFSIRQLAKPVSLEEGNGGWAPNLANVLSVFGIYPKEEI